MEFRCCLLWLGEFSNLLSLFLGGSLSVQSILLVFAKGIDNPFQPMNLKTVIYTRIDLGALSFPLKTKSKTKQKHFLLFLCYQKKKKKNCNQFYDTDSKPIYSWIGMPLKSPHLESKYKTQRHHCGAGIYTHLLSNDLPTHCGRREMSQMFFYWFVFKIMMANIFTKWKQQNVFPSGPAWEGLSLGITAVNCFNVSTKWPRFDPPLLGGQEMVLCVWSVVGLYQATFGTGWKGYWKISSRAQKSRCL